MMPRYTIALLALCASACSGNPLSSHPVDVTVSERSEYSIDRYEADPVQGPIIRAIGVYEGGSDHSFRHHPRADVKIEIEDQGGQPLYLAVSSYEPVKWVFSGPGVASLRGVYVAGYNKHTVEGISSGIVRNHSGLENKTEGRSADYDPRYSNDDPCYSDGMDRASADSQTNEWVSCTYTYAAGSGGGCDSAEQLLKNARDRFRAPIASFTGIYNAQAFVVRARAAP